MDRIMLIRILCVLLLVGVAVLLALLESEVRKNQRLEEKIKVAGGLGNVPENGGELYKILPKEIPGNLIGRINDGSRRANARRWNQIGNLIGRINDGWMLITSGNMDSYNTMTASWGSFGEIWNKDVATVYVFPSRYTFQFMEKNDHFTLCFFGPEYRKALKYCGSHSGRDSKEVNKAVAAGLTPESTELGNVYFKEACLVVECKILYSDGFHESGYKNGIPEVYKRLKQSTGPGYDEKNDFHKLYLGEIVNCMIR
ncbi:MAG: flavin reductase [Bacteroidales bacterium]|jgi:flavin reductase (DIM6/NTAB) family NADH-FMN oxidoreductase RutF|nr:flavin reductase [Bacteroidales bacterium]MCI2121253.1 flavin reductase [Bacteroidales bacterium]MCI2146151.1 flavin reductase [Bacteroidales bacterium]